MITITKATINKSGKHREGGTLITISMNEKITVFDYLSLRFGGKEHVFEVKQLTTDGVKLIGEALEVGHYRNLLQTSEYFDIRWLIDLELQVITDEAKIELIKDQSGLC